MTDMTTNLSGRNVGRGPSESTSWSAMALVVKCDLQARGR